MWRSIVKIHDIYTFRYLLSPSRDHRTTNVTESKRRVYLSPLYDSIVVCQEVGRTIQCSSWRRQWTRESQKRLEKPRSARASTSVVSVLSLVNLEFLAVFLHKLESPRWLFFVRHCSPRDLFRSNALTLVPFETRVGKKKGTIASVLGRCLIRKARNKRDKVNALLEERSLGR